MAEEYTYNDDGVSEDIYDQESDTISGLSGSSSVTPVNTSDVAEKDGGMTDATKEGIFQVAGALGGMATSGTKAILDKAQKDRQKNEARQIYDEERTFDNNRNRKLNKLREQEASVNENRFALNKAKQQWDIKFDRMQRELDKVISAYKMRDAASANIRDNMRDQNTRNIILDMFSGKGRS